MRLHQFLRENLEMLADEWGRFARTQVPAAVDLDPVDLRNSAAEFFSAVADDMEAARSPTEEREKSEGKRPGDSPGIKSCASLHADTRLAQGFTLDQMASEYRALRAAVLRDFAGQEPPTAELIHDFLRFSEAMDQGWYEAMARYSTRLAHAREMFLGILSHDLRTPLNAILMGAQVLMKDDSLPSEAMRTVVRIFNSAGNTTRMIEDLLDFTRTRLGTQLPMNVAPVQLGDLLRETLEELATTYPAADLRYEGEGDLAGRWDCNRLAQMLCNLVQNAIQHGEPGRPVWVRAEGRNGEVLIKVHNDGPPIDPRIADRIFDPLMRGVVQEAERRSRQDSLGLGLYISLEIAKAHGGRIDVESSLEEGTTFTVCLPRLQAMRRQA